MRSTLPFLGVRVPEVRRITRAAIRGRGDADELFALVSALWDGAAHREDWYAAMTVLAAPPIRDDPRLLPTVEHLVRTGAWWDVSDDLARRVGERLDRNPDATADLVRSWALDDDRWIRRVAVICQLHRGDHVDVHLLRDTIVPNLPDGDVFIRKAIGWALRQYARTDPSWVDVFLATHTLSTLSRREATKRRRTRQPGDCDPIVPRSQPSRS